MVFCEAYWKCLQGIDWALAGEWIDEELMADGTKLGPVVIDIVCADGEFGTDVVVLVFTEVIKPGKS